MQQLVDKLANMRELAQSGLSAPVSGVNGLQGKGNEGVDFSKVLSNTLNHVNQTQKSAADLATRFELGDDQVHVAEVMVALQKSRIEFQALTQVRNKVLSAYQDIMNMSV